MLTRCGSYTDILTAVWHESNIWSRHEPYEDLSTTASLPPAKRDTLRTDISHNSDIARMQRRHPLQKVVHCRDQNALCKIGHVARYFLLYGALIRQIIVIYVNSGSQKVRQ